MKDIRKGLSQLGVNPFTNNHCYVKLDLKEGAFKDVSAVADFVNLQQVDLSCNMLADSAAIPRPLSSLSNLPVLLTLDVSNNELKEVLDYDVMKCDEEKNWAEGTNVIGSVLQSANFANNAIAQIRDLKDHQYLVNLDLSGNSIKQIRGMQGLKMLQSLNLGGNRIERIEGLDNLPIVELLLDGNCIKEVENLGSLNRLEKLNLNGNSVASLRGLKDCGSLRELDLGGNSISVIREVEWICEIGRLAKLTLADNECSSKEFYRLRVLSRIQGLSVLDATGVAPEEKVKAMNLYGGESSDLGNRTSNYGKYFDGEELINFLPPFVEQEADPMEEKKEDGGSLSESMNTRASGFYVSGVLDEALKSATGKY